MYKKNYPIPETAQPVQKSSPQIATFINDSVATPAINDSIDAPAVKEKNSRSRRLFKAHEFWHPRVFEIPYYFYLAWQCAKNRIGVKSIAKANYNLYHGEIGLGSKFETQLAFNQDYFLPTVLIENASSIAEKKSQIISFIEEHNYPVILKSDVGCVGKGIVKIDNETELDEKLPILIGNYILQKFTHYKYECGIFYIRQGGVPKITGINEKHFPTVTGNGINSIMELAEQHIRFTHHWHSFLQKIDTNRVPAEGEQVVLSFIGSHTLGCKFTDDTHLLNPALEQAIFDVFADQPGFNFGRVDVKAESQEALLKGEFIVIEVNGVASLPTHMFDPKLSVFQAYKIFFKHARFLAKIGREHRHRDMELMSIWNVIKKATSNLSMLNKVHRKLKE